MQRGSGEYLEAWASRVDHMANEGWEVLECVRRPQRFGLWTVLLFRTGQDVSRRKMNQDLSPGGAN